jgi:metal-sulfur cluster biosynthetic enzyme
MLIAMVHRAVEDMDSVKEVKVDLVWEPPWDPVQMASDTAKDLLGIW